MYHVTSRESVSLPQMQTAMTFNSNVFSLHLQGPEFAFVVVLDHAAHKLRQLKRAKRSGAARKRKAGPWKRAGPLWSAHGGATLWKNKKNTAQRHVRPAPKEPRRAESVGGQDRSGGARAASPRNRRRNFLRAVPHADYFSTGDRLDPAAATQRRGGSRRWPVSGRSRRGRRCPCFPASRRWRIPRRA